MHPELFHVAVFGQPLRFGSYGVLVVLALALGLVVTRLRARRFGLEPFDAFAATAIAAVSGWTGSVLLDAAVQWRQVLAGQYPWDQPGLVFLGGLLGGVAGAWAYTRAYGVSLLAVADAAAPGIALGHAVGRVGCLLGGCCYGRPWAEAPARVIELAGGARHPVQLYEAALLVLLAGGLLALSPPRRRPGAIFARYLVGYGVLRIVTELFRGDDQERGFLIPGVWSTSQTLSLVLVAAGVMGLRAGRRRAAAPPA